MKLHPPKPDERFLTIVDDCDSDEPEIVFHTTREVAETYVTEQYDGIPDTTEPGGEQYDATERRNCVIHVCEIVSRTEL